MTTEPQLHLVLELESEVARWKRRTLFLVSVCLHAVLIVLILFEPSIFRRGAALLGLNLRPEQKETTFLLLPPDLMKQLRAPKTNRLSDQNRLARGRAPKINPNALPMPYLRGNTPVPKLAGGGAPKTPPAPPPSMAQAPRPAAEPPASPPKPKPPEESKLRLMDVQTPPQRTTALNSRLGLSTPEEAIRQSLQDAAQSRSTGAVPGPGNSPGQFNNLNSNFSTQGPIILSDTRGVDFGPYLARILLVVRRNWYAVIPESARLGEKGETSVVFEILKDGSVPELRLVGASGHEPLDRAALAGLRASIPFPPLPSEFTGRHLVLQFNFLYNMGYGY